MTETVSPGEATSQQQTQKPPEPNKKPNNPHQSILHKLFRRNPKEEPASPTWTERALGKDDEGSLLGPAKKAFEEEAKKFEDQQKNQKNQDRSKFLYEIGRRIFPGKPEETIKEVSIEEPKRESTMYTRKVNLLLALTRVQHEILRLIGHTEEKRLLHVYEHARGDYLRLCQSCGIQPSKHITTWDSRNYRHLPLEQQLQQAEEAFFRVLIQPITTLHEHGIQQDTKKEELLRLLLSSPDIQSNQDLKASEWPEDVRTKVSQEITHARIAALALYDKFHWREFTRIMMGNHAGRFSTEGGVRLSTNIKANEFQEKATKTLETILLTGVPYRLSREYWKRKNSNTKNQQNQEYMYEVESVPLSVPLGIRRNSHGELEGVFPPKVQTQYKKVQSLEEALRAIESTDSPQPQDALLQIFDVDEDGPGSQLAFMNNETQIQIRQRMMKTSNPLSITIVRYRNNEVYVSGISDHTTTDGVPLADHIIGKFMQQMESWGGETLPLGDFSIDTLIQNSQQAERLEPYTEYTAATTFQGLIKLRTFIKEAHKNNIQIVDEKGNPVNINLFSVGRLISILEGQRHMNLARERGIARQSTKGTLVNSELINEQLMEVSITDLGFPEDPREWISIKNGMIVVSDQIIESLQKASIIFSQQSHPEDATETVRQVFYLPRMLWRLNAVMAKRVLGRWATKNVGATMVSILNPRFNVIGGPALVPEWQDLAATYGRVDAETGKTPMKIKIGGDQRKAIAYLDHYLRENAKWQQSLADHVQKLRNELGNSQNNPDAKKS